MSSDDFKPGDKLNLRPHGKPLVKSESLVQDPHSADESESRFDLYGADQPSRVSGEIETDLGKVEHDGTGHKGTLSKRAPAFDQGDSLRSDPSRTDQEVPMTDLQHAQVRERSEHLEPVMVGTSRNIDRCPTFHDPDGHTSEAHASQTRPHGQTMTTEKGRQEEQWERTTESFRGGEERRRVLEERPSVRTADFEPFLQEPAHEISAIVSELKHLINQFKAMNDQICDWGTRTVDLQKKMKEVHHYLATDQQKRRQQNEELGNSYRQQQDYVSKLKKQIEDAKAENVSLIKNNENLRRSLSESEDTRRNLDRERSGLIAEKQKLNEKNLNLGDSIASLQAEREDLINKGNAYERQAEELAEANRRFEQEVERLKKILRTDLLQNLESAFGVGSPLATYVTALGDEAFVRIGHTCLNCLPRIPVLPNRSSQQPNINDLIALSTSFLANIADVDIPDRQLFLDKIANHLSAISQGFIFQNVETQPYDGRRHVTLAALPPQSADSRVRHMMSFLVTHKNTSKTYKHALVCF